MSQASGPEAHGGEVTFVHPTAIVEPGARVGAGSCIWHHAHVREGAQLGAHCIVGKNAFVDAGVVVGAGSKIQNNACLYAGAILEEEVFVGPGAVLTNDRFPRASSPEWQPLTTVVRQGASIGANATVVSGRGRRHP
jgi:UDP-3-O-[3-hydroxymyristoyl] glucosamine N-acyltransferase